MAKSTPTPHTTHQDVKDQLLDFMHGLEPDDPKFTEVLNQYKTLCEIEANTKHRSNGLEPWIPAIGNVAGIGLMGVFEAFGNIFTTKALQVFGGKLKH